MTKKIPVLEVLKKFKDAVEERVLSPRGLTLRSCGVKKPQLDEPLAPATGFWEDPKSVSSKPPRWIVQVVQDPVGVAARFAQGEDGTPFGMSRTVGYINNRGGNCSVAAFRVLLSVLPSGQKDWTFPDGWECVLALSFKQPLPAGTSGDALSDFNPADGTIGFGGGAAKKSFKIDHVALLKVPGTEVPATGPGYDEAVEAVANLIGASVVDGSSEAAMNALVDDLEAIFKVEPSSGAFSLAEDTNLSGVDLMVYKQIEAAVNSGKRHIILYGPPGTGKTTLAEYLARELSEWDDGDGSSLMLTASSSWSAQDLVGGYQPMGGGKIGFIPGALLRDFDKPAIIDELNRCPIDKVLGPLFSVLSGQSSTLPCRVDVTDPNSPFYVVHPVPRAGMAKNEFAPGAAWRLICTLNTYDKTQLGQISYALSRRFAWIKVGAPSNPEAFVTEIGIKRGFASPTPAATHPLAKMWSVVNSVREIGGAPIIDFLMTLRAIEPGASPFEPPAVASLDAYLAAFRMCVLPLMDGLSTRQATDLARGVSAAWGLDAARSAEIDADCAEFAA